MFGRNDDEGEAVNLPEPTAPAEDLSMPEDTAATTSTAPTFDAQSTPTDTPAPSDDNASASSGMPMPLSSTPVVSPAKPDVPALSPDDLLTIKQDALQELQPLVGHLEQAPAEEFRTLMMMIQASDDQSLLKKAYASAQKITDDKVRAQALLDIINEINYFTQNKAS